MSAEEAALIPPNAAAMDSTGNRRLRMLILCCHSTLSLARQMSGRVDSRHNPHMRRIPPNWQAGTRRGSLDPDGYCLLRLTHAEKFAYCNGVGLRVVLVCADQCPTLAGPKDNHR